MVQCHCNKFGNRGDYTVKNKSFKYLFLGIIGGVIYCLIEVISRGYTHWTMAILGGICFVCLGLINEILSWETPLMLQMLIGGTIITVLELITGCIVNLWLGWNVWDYSNERFNIWGQICLKYSCYWFWLSAVGIVIDDFIRWKFFNEEKPRYKLI